MSAISSFSREIVRGWELPIIFHRFSAVHPSSFTSILKILLCLMIRITKQGNTRFSEATCELTNNSMRWQILVRYHAHSILPDYNANVRQMPLHQKAFKYLFFDVLFTFKQFWTWKRTPKIVQRVPRWSLYPASPNEACRAVVQWLKLRN